MADDGEGPCKEGEECWLEQLVEDDEIDTEEAAFMKGYREAEEEGFG